MLYPDFNQLVNLQHQARRLAAQPGKQVWSAVSGDYDSKRYGAGLEFAGVREYVFGDDIRNIDWRVTARTSKPHSKIFHTQSEQNVVIVIDMNPYMHFGTRGTFKSVQAAKVAALIGWFFNQSANKVGGIIFGGICQAEVFKPTKSKQSLLRMLQKLSAAKKPENYTALHQILANLNKITAADSAVYIISDFNNTNCQLIAKDMAKLRSKGCNIGLIEISDNADSKIANIGLVSFVNYAGQEIVIDTASIKGRQKYHQKWLDNQQQIKELAKKTAAKLITVKTDDDVYLKLKNNI